MTDATPGLIATTLHPVSATRSYFHLALLTIAAAAVSYARTAVSPLQEAMRGALLLSDNEVALLQGAALALPMLLAAVPLGLVIDRYSRVRLLFGFAVLDLIGSVLTSMASDFTVLFGARCLIGLAMAATNSTVFSLVADLFAPAMRGRAGMVLAVGQFGGMSAAFALGGAFLGSQEGLADGWRTAMLLLSVPLIPAALAMLAMREPQRTGRILGNPSTRESFVEVWRFRAVIFPPLLGLVIIELAVGAVLIWAAPALSRSFALSPERIGAILAAALLVSGVLGPIAGGTAADICQRTGGPRRTMQVLGVFSLASAPLGLFGLLSSVQMASILLVTFVTVVGAIVVMATTLFTVVIPNELRGLCISIAAAACVTFGTGLAPVAVSVLSNAIGGPSTIATALAIVCVVCGALCALTFGLGSRSFPRTLPHSSAR